MFLTLLTAKIGQDSNSVQQLPKVCFSLPPVEIFQLGSTPGCLKFIKVYSS